MRIGSDDSKGLSPAVREPAIRFVCLNCPPPPLSPTHPRVGVGRSLCMFATAFCCFAANTQAWPGHARGGVSTQAPGCIAVCSRRRASGGEGTSCIRSRRAHGRTAAPSPSKCRVRLLRPLPHLGPIPPAQRHGRRPAPVRVRRATGPNSRARPPGRAQRRRSSAPGFRGPLHGTRSEARAATFWHLPITGQAGPIRVRRRGKGGHKRGGTDSVYSPSSTRD